MLREVNVKNMRASTKKFRTIFVTIWLEKFTKKQNLGDIKRRLKTLDYMECLNFFVMKETTNNVKQSMTD